MTFDSQFLQLMLKGTLETLYMTLVSTALAYILGVPIGIVLFTTAKDGIKPNPGVNSVLGVIVNVLRSVPFLILLVTVMPVTRFITGTTLGSSATIVPLVIAAAPFIGRMVEASLREVDSGVIEAGRSMGASTMQLIFRVLLPEAGPSLVSGAAIAVMTILGYSAMAGFTGGGGLGSIATNYGYYRYETGIMLVTVALLVLIVQGLQSIGNGAARKIDKRGK